ncbi:PTS sugar transporter subunit IIA [Collinsella provencensis]|uniref:PTS sugar transporter subunit IIA n=1 Tax=Collinsella provencensis TaxID=1937461 RepID=UPI000C81E346|nr:PTS sugar transporter subunit IIA [Collinsella provencensis]
MKKILVASHGYLADGIKSSVGILTGNQDLITAVNAYVDESDYTPRIQEFIDSVAPEDDAVIFTDIYGGSVFQKVALLEPEKKGIVHVTGVNLAAVIEALIRTDPLTPEVMDEIVSGASALMQRVKPVSELAAADEDSSSDDGFFE